MRAEHGHRRRVLISRLELDGVGMGTAGALGVHGLSWLMDDPVASRVSDRLPPRGHIFEKSSSCSSLRWPTVLQLRMRPCRTWTSTWTAGASRQDPPTRSLRAKGQPGRIRELRRCVWRYPDTALPIGSVAPEDRWSVQRCTRALSRRLLLCLQLEGRCLSMLICCGQLQFGHRHSRRGDRRNKRSTGRLSRPG